MAIPTIVTPELRVLTQVAAISCLAMLKSSDVIKMLAESVVKSDDRLSTASP